MSANSAKNKLQNSIRMHLKSNYFCAAKEEIAADLEDLNKHFNLLVISSSIDHSFGDHERALDYAKILISHHPSKWEGYGLAARYLIALKRLDESQEHIKAGLQRFPNQLNLLIIATDVFRSASDYRKSLECANLMIKNHPNLLEGYLRKAQDLIAMKRLEESQEHIEIGLKRFPKQLNLLAYAANIYYTIGNYKKSLVCQIF